MRKATPKEIQERTVHSLVVSFKNPNGKNKNLTFKDVNGNSLKEVEQQSLAQAKERFPLGVDFFIKESDSWVDQKKCIFWDWKELPNDDFWKEIDNQLAPFDLESVEYPFDGDAVAWFVGPRIKK